MAKKLPFGILYIDSMRSRAYLNAFLNKKIYPKYAIIMGDELVINKEMFQEAHENSYKDIFFDISISPLKFFKEHNISVIHIDTNNINDTNLISCLKQIQGIPYWIFTGGGIVKRKMLNCGKKLIHIHPGVVPSFRGSTCFYYSILQEGTLGATAFIMEPELDRGPTIIINKFTINMNLDSKKLRFMDYVADPYIRMKTLEEVLEKLSDIDNFKTEKQIKDNHNTLFVMHPILRKLAITRINKKFDSNAPVGIFKDNTMSVGNP